MEEHWGASAGIHDRVPIYVVKDILDPLIPVPPNQYQVGQS